MQQNIDPLRPSEPRRREHASAAAPPERVPAGRSESSPLLANPDCRSAFFDELARASKIMVVDDEPFNTMIVCKHLKDVGYRSFVSTSDPTEAVSLLKKEAPDLLVLDVVMPQVSGLDLLAAVRADPQTLHIPVLILTASSDAETKLCALERGATDFLAKPVDPSELVLRIRNALTVKAHQDYLQDFSRHLEAQVRLRTMELEVARREAIHCLARAAEFRDRETGFHVVRVGEYVGLLARHLGMDEDRVELLKLAAQLHDVGKIGVSDMILLKPGKLDDDELTTMRRHCEFGFKIIAPVSAEDAARCAGGGMIDRASLQACRSPIMRTAAVIAQTHHEWWDGTGYPKGLAGEAIPIEGRMTAVADVFDALSSSRPYKNAMEPQACFAMMEQQRGTHFDPELLDLFLAHRDEVLELSAQYADGEVGGRQ